MKEIDLISTQLFEEAKRFLEKAQEAEGDPAAMSAFAHAALLLGFSSLEAHLNAIAEELTLRAGLSVLDESILKEREFGLVCGRFETKPGLKMYRLEDRLTHILVTFSKSKLPPPNTESWWPGLKSGITLRNELVHPKDELRIDISAVAASLTAILGCLGALYKRIFGRAFPPSNRSLQSTLTF